MLVERGRTGATRRAAQGRRSRSCSAGAARRPRRWPPPACRSRSSRGSPSAIGAAAYAGIPVTHRGVSTHFTVVTGHEDPAKDRTDVDWEALARAGGTLVILMGAGRIGDIARRADRRRPRDPTRRSPRCATAPVPISATVRATLATIADAGVRAAERDRRRRRRRRSTSRGSRPDRCSAGRSWSPAPASRRASCAPGSRTLGAEVVELPAIAIEPVDVRAARSLDRYEWLVFTSANGVARVLRPRPRRRPGSTPARSARVRVAAIGPGTARELDRTRRASPICVPERFVAESLLDAFPAPDRAGARPRVLIARAEQARDVLPEGLARARLRGRRAARLPHRARPTRRRRASTACEPAQVDAITFTSSSTVDQLLRHARCALPDPQPLVVSIGPVTSRHRRRPRPARRRRGRPRTPSTASSTPSLPPSLADQRSNSSSSATPEATATILQCPSTWP